MEEQLRNMTNFVSNTQSRIEVVKDLTRKEYYIYLKSFDEFLQMQRVEFWPFGGDRTFPHENSDEEDICQPFVTNMLQLFVSGKVKVERRKKHENIRSVPDPRAYSNNIIHGNKRRSSDVVFYDGINNNIALATTLLGEVTFGGNGEFPNSSIGQVTDAMARLMKLQPFRLMLIGFLTDGRRFLFLRCTKQQQQVGCVFAHSSVYTGMHAWQVLYIAVATHTV